MKTKTNTPALTAAKRRVRNIRNQVLARTVVLGRRRKYTVTLRKGGTVRAHNRTSCWVVRARS